MIPQYHFFQLILSQLPTPQFHPILSGRVSSKNRFSFERETLILLKEYHSAFTENCDLLLETLEPHFQGELAPKFDSIMSAVGGATRSFGLFYKTAEIGQVPLDLISQVQETLDTLIGWSDLLLIMVNELHESAGLTFWIFRNEVESVFEQFFYTVSAYHDPTFFVELPAKNTVKQFMQHAAFLKLMKENRAQ